MTGYPSVLVLDDNTELLDAMGDILRANGYNVTALRDGYEAIESIRKHRPDLIICDVMMPNMDGFQFHHKIRENDEWCQIPFVFLTALADPKEVRYGKELGCDDYLTKPFDPLDLVSVVKGKLSLAGTRAEKNEERMESYRKRVINTLSHEFRTPLVAVNTGAELLLEQHGRLDEERVAHLLKSIQRGGHRLQRLVEDFMTVQQIESGAAAALAQRMRKSVSAVTVVETAMQEFAEYLVDEKLNCAFGIAPDEKTRAALINVYDAQIINAFGRLLSNAHKFNIAGKAAVVQVARRGKQISIKLRDFGPGLSEEMLATACKLFTQIDRDRLEQQGCGLGLTIAGYFVHINGGELKFRRPDDKVGLEVEMVFPVITE